MRGAYCYRGCVFSQEGVLFAIRYFSENVFTSGFRGKQVFLKFCIITHIIAVSYKNVEFFINAFT